MYPHSVLKMVLTLQMYDVVAPPPAITGNGYFVVIGMNQKLTLVIYFFMRRNLQMKAITLNT